MAPIVTAESIDMAVAWRGNRWDKGAEEQASAGAGEKGSKAAEARTREGEEGTASFVGFQPSSLSLHPSSTPGDYINCPLSRDEYFAFVEAVNAAEKTRLHEFEADEAARRYFEACLPIEVLAGRDPQALSFGPMTPIGLRDPRTGRRPFAVVQLRQDNVAGTLYNLVGFQTNIKWSDQEQVLRMIPGLGRAEFARFGQMHRNTFIDSPRLLRPTLQWHDRDALFFAGQITGTEGYVGSAAGGMLAGLNAVRVALGQPPVSMPPTTMMGALFRYITQARSADTRARRLPGPQIGGLPAHESKFWVDARAGRTAARQAQTPRSLCRPRLGRSRDMVGGAGRAGAALHRRSAARLIRELTHHAP